ncbi:hypothetical protein O181_046883 [Austropuccinia psidii MF-1]|uniref:Uncharacterized protein n=1 Tax=Austropuccinia psidii MF-1 TaxID=1389203 RepID=A0A9Q3DT68_9BASI|nr:hypothetical protein [Austropuccinia psidii MF-1]
MYPVHLRNKPEDRQGLFRTKGSGSGHHSGWKDTEANHTNAAIHLPIQQEPKAKGLKGYGSGSSATQTPQIFIPMEHGQQAVQPRYTLGRTWSRLPEDKFKRDTLQRPYVNHQRMESQ